MKLEILYEDDNYIFINKPSGYLSIPDRHNEFLPSVAGILRNEYPEIFIVHRIDRETSGCICFAKNEETHRYTSLLFENRKVEKIYTCIVSGTPIEKEGTIEASIMEHPTIKGKMVINQKQGKESKTDYKVLESFGMYSYIECTLHTGRTHQIRIHMQDIGHPVLCDPIYGNGESVYISSLKKRYNLSKNEEEEKPILSRLALHACKLGFETKDKQQLLIEAPLPKDMKALLNQCRKWLK